MKYLKNKEIKIVKQSGKIILGIPIDELGDEFVEEFDRLLTGFESNLQRDVHTLLWLFNSRLMSLVYNFRLTPFSGLNESNQIKFFEKIMISKVALFRTSYVTLKALCGWSYYSLDKCWEEVGFLGHTIGREHETPTFLYGKEPWTPKEVVK